MGASQNSGSHSKEAKETKSKGIGLLPYPSGNRHRGLGIPLDLVSITSIHMSVSTCATYPPPGQFLPIAAALHIPYPLMVNSRALITRFAFALIFQSTLAISPSSKAFAKTIVLDPGHGGTDLGTVHRTQNEFVTEKYVTLLIAKEIQTQLSARGYQAFLTRKRDQNLTLPARTQLANRLGADLFISIHMNSEHTAPHGTRRAQGVETFILNNTSDSSSRRLAELENTDNRVTQPQADGPMGADAPPDLALILKDLRLDANQGESKRLACHLQAQVLSATAQALQFDRRPTITSSGLRSSQAAPLRTVGYALPSSSSGGKGLGASAPSRNRGIKQALFHVLLGADMPSALLEVGFLAHPTDRKLVLTPRYRRQIAKGIVQAIDQYFVTKGRPEAIQEHAKCLVH